MHEPLIPNSRMLIEETPELQHRYVDSKFLEQEPAYLFTTQVRISRVKNQPAHPERKTHLHCRHTERNRARTKRRQETKKEQQHERMMKNQGKEGTNNNQRQNTQRERNKDTKSSLLGYSKLCGGTNRKRWKQRTRTYGAFFQ